MTTILFTNVIYILSYICFLNIIFINLFTWLNLLNTTIHLHDYRIILKNIVYKKYDIIPVRQFYSRPGVARTRQPEIEFC